MNPSPEPTYVVVVSNVTSGVMTSKSALTYDLKF